jgi:hypothetical protein
MTTRHTALDLPGSGLSPHVVNTGDAIPTLSESAATNNGAGVILAFLADGHPPVREEKHRRQVSLAVT